MTWLPHFCIEGYIQKRRKVWGVLGGYRFRVRRLACLVPLSFMSGLGVAFLWMIWEALKYSRMHA